jgi:hypothetical protein
MGSPDFDLSARPVAGTGFWMQTISADKIFLAMCTAIAAA